MSYDVKRLKYLASINDDTLSEDTDPDFELQYVDIGNINNGNIDGIATYCFELAPSRARRKVEDGDVIISTVRTYLQAIAPVRNPPDNLIVSTGFAVVRPKLKNLSGAFCKYALRDVEFIDEVICRSVGISYPAINSSDLGDIEIVAPPIETQAKIADYLDRKTAELDQLIGEKKNLLKLLDEKKRALIAHAVTRGLNPDAPLKETGIPWLGKIPEHWEVERTKWLLPEIDERSETGDEELLTVSHLTGVTKRSDKNVNMFLAESLEGYKKCKAGDLVINTLWAWMGAMGISPVDGVISPAYNVYRPVSEIDSKYLDLMVRTPDFISEITRYSKGVWSSRLRLYPEGLYKTYLPVPPLSEQKVIVTGIEKRLGKFDELKTVAEKTITLLQERRTALISEAVTGKLSEEVLNAG